MKLDGYLFDGLQCFIICCVKHCDFGALDIDFGEINDIGPDMLNEAL